MPFCYTILESGQCIFIRSHQGFPNSDYSSYALTRYWRIFSRFALTITFDASPFGLARRSWWRHYYYKRSPDRLILKAPRRDFRERIVGSVPPLEPWIVETAYHRRGGLVALFKSSYGQSAAGFRFTVCAN